MANSIPTSERILDEAQALIMAGGYNGFSYADIASAVGIRKASIHHHFPAKADLVEKLVEQYRKQTEAALEGLEAQVPDPLQQLRHYAGYWQQCIADGSRPFCICALLACEIDSLPEGVRAEVRQHFRLLNDWAGRVMARGARDGVLALRDDPAVAAEVFTAAVHGAMLAARASGNPAVFATVTSALISGLSAQG